MKKLILMSILIATFLIPILAASRYPNLRFGARKVQKQLFVFCVFWVLAVLYVMPRL